MWLIVDVQPLTAGSFDLGDQLVDQSRSDAAPAVARGDDRVEEKSVKSSVPAGMDEADETVVVEGAYPDQAMTIEPGGPRLHSDGRWICRIGKRSCVELRQEPVVDGKADPIVQLAHHAADGATFLPRKGDPCRSQHTLAPGDII